MEGEKGVIFRVINGHQKEVKKRVLFGAFFKVFSGIA